MSLSRPRFRIFTTKKGCEGVDIKNVDHVYSETSCNIYFFFSCYGEILSILGVFFFLSQRLKSQTVIKEVVFKIRLCRINSLYKKDDHFLVLLGHNVQVFRLDLKLTAIRQRKTGRTMGWLSNSLKSFFRCILRAGCVTVYTASGKTDGDSG